MMKVILDTNIIISGLGWEGKPQQILNVCLDGKFKLSKDDLFILMGQSSQEVYDESSHGLKVPGR